jgi:hypothetical protein
VRNAKNLYTAEFHEFAKRQLHELKLKDAETDNEGKKKELQMMEALIETLPLVSAALAQATINKIGDGPKSLLILQDALIEAAKPLIEDVTITQVYVETAQMTTEVKSGEVDMDIDAQLPDECLIAEMMVALSFLTRFDDSKLNDVFNLLAAGLKVADPRIVRGVCFPFFIVCLMNCVENEKYVAGCAEALGIVGVKDRSKSIDLLKTKLNEEIPEGLNINFKSYQPFVAALSSLSLLTIPEGVCSFHIPHLNAREVFHFFFFFLSFHSLCYNYRLSIRVIPTDATSHHQTMFVWDVLIFVTKNMLSLPCGYLLKVSASVEVLTMHNVLHCIFLNSLMMMKQAKNNITNSLRRKRLS